MSDKFVYDRLISKKNFSFEVHFEGVNNSGTENILVRETCDKYFDKIDINRDITKIIGDIRTLFRNFNEEKLVISFLKKKEYSYKICYDNKILVSYQNNFLDNDCKFNFGYEKNDNSMFFNTIDNNEYNTNSNKFIDIYIQKLKELNLLKNISINNLPYELLYINELYKLFYGRYPNYNSDNIIVKIQNIVYILCEYGLYLPNSYFFSNNNDNKIPLCENLTSLIKDAVPYGMISSCDICIDKKHVDIIKIIKDSISEYKYKEINFEKALLYLAMVLYTTKYNLKLGFSVDDVSNSLNCTKKASESGLRLYRGINKNIYEKN